MFTFYPKEDISNREQRCDDVDVYMHIVLDKDLVDIINQLCRP